MKAPALMKAEQAWHDLYPFAAAAAAADDNDV
jgi:hypothetical protein